MDLTKLRITRLLSALLPLLGMTVAHNAAAFPLDNCSGCSSYPVEVVTTSDSVSVVSNFCFNSSYCITLSDGNFDIDGNYNDDGTLNGNYNSVTFTQNINTGLTISGSAVLASLEWEASPSGDNTGLMDPLSGEIDVGLALRINFTGSWLIGSETCTTTTFAVSMLSSGNTNPVTSSTGIDYTYSSGVFQSTTSGFNIPNVQAFSSPRTCLHASALQSGLSVGASSSPSAMQIYWGYPIYYTTSAKISGS